MLDPVATTPTIHRLRQDLEPESEAAKTIAEQLGDSSAVVRERVGLVVQALGEEGAQALLERTLTTLASGRARGAFSPWDGSPGGLFLQLAAEELPAEVRDRIFARRGIDGDCDFRNKPTLPAPPGLLESMRPAAPSPYQTQAEPSGSSRAETLGQISDIDFARSRIRVMLRTLSPSDRQTLLLELLEENK